jgi:hypothetical protein
LTIFNYIPSASGSFDPRDFRNYPQYTPILFNDLPGIPGNN